MDVYQYLVDVVNRVSSGWELPLNHEVSFAKNNSGIVELVICSDWIDCAIPINSIRSEGDKIIVNNQISVGITYDGFLEIDLESEPYKENRVSVEFIEKLIQDGRIFFTITPKNGVPIFFYDNHTVKYGLCDFDLSESKVHYLGTTCEGMRFDLGIGVELRIPENSKITIGLDDLDD